MKSDFEIIKITDKSYPNALKHIHKPPQKLYVKGSAEILNNFSIAVVGTRKMSEYGKVQTEIITEFLAKNGITIISGFAKGIDITAHITAIKNNAPTIAVLGGGFNNIYPPAHKNYIDEILKNGAIISEYPPDEQPLKAYFPQRNRIIAGLSEATIVIEAPEKSGAIITAHLALNCGKEVFAVPADIDRENSRGCLKLIQKCEAHPIIFPSDILEQMDLQIKIPFINEISDAAPTNFNEKESLIFKCLLKTRPKTIDEINRSAKLNIPEIMAIISILEINGMVERTGGGFIRK